MSKHDKNQALALDRIASALEEQPRRDTSREPRTERLPLLARFILLVGSSPASERRAVAARRSFPIRGYVGPNGGGKSLCMVDDVLPTLRGIPWTCSNPDHAHTKAGKTAGLRRVLSTVRLLDGDNDHPLYDKFDDFGQLLTLEHADVLMDEIVGVANSRDAHSLPSPVQNLLVQLRRRDVTLSWSAPNWARSDKIIREVTQLVTECRGFYPGRAQAAEGSGVQLWAPKRVFKFRSFDTVDFEEWTAGKRDKLKAIASVWFKGPGSRAFAAYDTLGSVAMVSGGDPDGVCQYCDKKKRAEFCKGHTDTEIAAVERELAGVTRPEDPELVWAGEMAHAH